MEVLGSWGWHEILRWRMRCCVCWGWERKAKGCGKDVVLCAYGGIGEAWGVELKQWKVGVFCVADRTPMDFCWDGRSSQYKFREPAPQKAASFVCHLYRLNRTESSEVNLAEKSYQLLIATFSFATEEKALRQNRKGCKKSSLTTCCSSKVVERTGMQHDPSSKLCRNTTRVDVYFAELEYRIAVLSWVTWVTFLQLHTRQTSWYHPSLAKTKGIAKERITPALAQNSNTRCSRPPKTSF